MNLLNSLVLDKLYRNILYKNKSVSPLHPLILDGGPPSNFIFKEKTTSNFNSNKDILHTLNQKQDYIKNKQTNKTFYFFLQFLRF